MNAKILVIDDEHSVRWAFERALQRAGYQVGLAETGLRGLALFSSFKPDITLLDIRMPEMDGITVLKKIREIDPNAQVIVMTAYSDMETTVTAMKFGAYDFLSKPFNIDDCLALIARGLHARNTTRNELTEPSAVLKAGGLIGNSPAMQEVYKLIGKVSAEDVTVLITGESGSGKELVAQAIHNNSNRSSKPFWAINCTAVAESLMESELFGYEKGAFTGAQNSKAGVFELSQGGTLFLDELGDMSLEMQANLLRVLEEREIVRVGGSRKIKVDVRIIAATNKDLRKYIQENRFRDDLFHRIKVIEIRLPPLRNRVEDIPVLANYFMAQLSGNRKGPPKQLSDEAIKLLSSYSWPGNVRELKNSVDQAYTLSRDQVIMAEDLPPEIITSPRRVFHHSLFVKPSPNISNFDQEKKEETPTTHEHTKMIGPAPEGNTAVQNSIQNQVSSFVREVLLQQSPGEAHEKIMGIIERELLMQALTMNKNNQVQTAIFLGITRNTLRTKIEKYKLPI
ncbi:MAG: sigma 54-interacting transcriptional regulator [Candidatus Riflebacteria bacterium]|nr:sigma 54-interacting transcriptional regulator [Candidatus Riflebacteria bacterium]